MIELHEIVSGNVPELPLNPKTRIQYEFPGKTSAVTVDCKAHESSLHAISFATLPGHPLWTESAVSKLAPQVAAAIRQWLVASNRYQTSADDCAPPQDEDPSFDAATVVPKNVPTVTTVALAQASFAGAPGLDPHWTASVKLPTAPSNPAIRMR